MVEIRLYTRKQCPLCQDAKEILLQLQDDYTFELREIDIEQSDEWTEKYGLMIPVIEINHQIVQYGNIDAFTICDFLSHN